MFEGRQASRWYQLHLAFAMVGMTAITIGLGGQIRLRLGLDGLGAYQREGFFMFLISASWAYGFRPIFWTSVPAYYQNLIRTILSLFMAAELLMAIVTVPLLLTQPNSNTEDELTGSILITVFAIAGIVCQISTVIWLLRYRKE